MDRRINGKKNRRVERYVKQDLPEDRSQEIEGNDGRRYIVNEITEEDVESGSVVGVDVVNMVRNSANNENKMVFFWIDGLEDELGNRKSGSRLKSDPPVFNVGTQDEKSETNFVVDKKTAYALYMSFYNIYRSYYGAMPKGESLIDRKLKDVSPTTVVVVTAILSFVIFSVLLLLTSL